MKPRSKKYVETRKAARGSKKATTVITDNGEENKKAIKKPKKVTSGKPTKPIYQPTSAAQKDTGGGNDS